MNIKIILVFLLLSSCATTTSNRSEISNEKYAEIKKQLNAFTSDGCSKWPDGTKSKPEAWLKCCYKHDRIYWLGGSEKQRETADKELRSCVKENFSNFMGILMYMGVRMGGRPAYKTSYRWGYGWNYDRGYISLSSKEYEYAQKLSPYKEFDELKDKKIDNL